MDIKKRIIFFLNQLQLILFFSLIFFLVLKYTPILDYMGISAISGILKILIGLLFFLKFLLIRHSIRVWINFVFFITVVSLVTYFSREFNLVVYVLIIFGMKKESLKSFICVAYYALISSCTFVVMLYFLGILPDVVVYRLGEARSAMGFNLPVTLPSFIFSISSIFVYLNFKKISIINITPLLLINVFIFYYTNGRTGIIFSILILIGSLIFKCLGKSFSSKILLYLNLLGLFFVNAISILTANLYSNGNFILMAIDKILTGRIYWWNLYWNTYDITLFGQQILRISSEARLKDSFSQIMILDNTYLSILIEYGFVFYIIIILCLIKLLFRLNKTKDIKLLWILFVNILIGISGNSLLFLETNVFIIIFSIIVESRKEEDIFE